MKAKKRVATPVEDPSEAIARQCRKLVTQRAMFAAGVAMVPIPGLDWLTDVGVLVKLLPEINRAFGLTPEQMREATRRGQRLDESKPGSGLGLSIVCELVGLYGGRFNLSRSSMGGLAAAVDLPGA